MWKPLSDKIKKWADAQSVAGNLAKWARSTWSFRTWRN